MNRFVLIVRDDYDWREVKSAWPLETALSKQEVEAALWEIAEDVRSERRNQRLSGYRLDGCSREFWFWSLLDDYSQLKPPKVLTVDEWFSGGENAT